ncbi:MAG: Arm DNA-binding domain-containing protein [Rudaea sp.]
MQTVNRLSDAKVRALRPAAAPYNVADILPTGGRAWRLKYRADGREKLLSLGVYPEVSVAAARQKRTAAVPRRSHASH